jgi:hypothetical protein
MSKRCKSSQIETPVSKPTANELKEWNKRLSAEGLSAEKGRDPRLVYVGNTIDIAFIEGAERMRRESGRTPSRNEES